MIQCKHTKSQMNQESLLQFIKDYWFVLAFVGSLVVTWTQFDARIRNNADSITRLDTQVATLNTALPSLQQSLAEVKVSVDFIKNYLINK